jgi:SAM-dependent methyltransferase
MNINESKSKHSMHESSMDYWSGAFDDKHDDTKRHFEMLSHSLPILKLLNPSCVLTIGDNRGRDAFFIKKNIDCHVVASDLDNKKLINAVNDGYIDECKVIDVENIDYPDNSFDLVFAKESFHHWPRPMLGLYEMLRVAKSGIILIEPNDCFSDQYEEVGNYVYRISLREIQKAAWSLYLNQILVKGFNDPYTTPLVFDEWLEEKKKLDQLGDSNVRQFNLLCLYINKNKLLRFDDGCNGYYKIHNRPINKFTESLK